MRRTLYQFSVLGTRNKILDVINITELRHAASERRFHPVIGHEDPEWQ